MSSYSPIRERKSLPRNSLLQLTVRLYSDLLQIESSKSYKEVNALNSEARLKESNIRKG